MTDHLTVYDVPLLNSTGWKPGFSGESWFKKDNEGNLWQAYESNDRAALTFVGPTRESRLMTRDDYDYLFTRRA